MTDLLVAKLENLPVDVVPDLGGINVGLRQVEVVGHQSDGLILEAGLEDEHAELHASQCQ